MASGCINGGTSSAVLFQKLTPDTQVQYTGVAIPSLGICTGDLLSEVEAIILQKLLDYSTGVGISLPTIDLTECDCFKQHVSCCGPESCQTLTCILQAYLDCMCEMYTDIQEIKTEITTITNEVDAMFDGPYDTGCLTGVDSTSKLPAIIQEIIKELCATEASITNIDTTIGNFLLTAIQTCTGNGSVIKSPPGSGSSATVEFRGFVPVGGILAFGGITTGKFDPTTGAGLSGTDWCNWHICNGLGGTVDLREQVIVGCGSTVMGGGTLPPNTDASNYSYRQNTIGEATHTLIPSETPAVGITGTINDPGHDHGIQYQHQERKIKTGGSDNYVDFSGTINSTTPWTEHTSTGDIVHPNVIGGGPGTEPGNVMKNKTGITTAGLITNGGGQAHENRQPSTALIYIQRIA